MDDAHADPIQRNLPSAKLGLRSSLRVAIKFDGKLAAAVVFLSFTPGFYQQKDVVIARRIADRLALGLSRDSREEANARAAAADERAARLESRVKALTDELDARTGYRRVVGDSHAWRDVLTQATQVAPTDTTALLLGESGTGKEVAARFIHRASPGETVPLWPSTVRRCRSSSSKRSCSATSGVPSRARHRPNPGSSSRPPAARCFLTRSPR